MLKSFRRAVGAYVVGTALDFYSSSLSGGVESNPFWRHADGSFYASHALLNIAFYASELALMSAALYMCLRKVDEKWAKVAVMAPWLWGAYGHLDAAIGNFMIQIPHFYVQLSGGF